MDTGTVSDASALVRVRDIPQPQLFLVLERARPGAGGARHSLASIERVTFARAGSRSTTRSFVEGQATLALSVPDPRMSSSHARLSRRGRDWVFEDHGSTNGSRINGKAVTAAITLQDGDWIELGQTLFHFHAALPTPANAEGDVESTALSGMAAAMGTLLPGLARDLETVARIARSDTAMLLLGETGTGKEVLARAIHRESRRSGAFVAVNCGALPPTLVESLLFGHKKGAFSGATQDELGFVRAADGGTLFLDEIGDLPKASQATLLRVLQEREVVPVGATRAIPVDLRVVSATHCPLGSLTQSGEFRSDLLARLSAFTHVLSPLRERMDDLGTLIAAILRKLGAGDACSLSTVSMQALIAHDFPLNVRELEQCLRVASVLAEGGRIEISQLGQHKVAAPNAQRGAPPAPSAPLSAEDEALRARLIEALEAHQGNVTHVGQAMGKARTQVQRWLRRFGLDPLAYKGR